jgi:hypothetical protein
MLPGLMPSSKNRYARLAFGRCARLVFVVFCNQKLLQIETY